MNVDATDDVASMAKALAVVNNRCAKFNNHKH